MKERVEEVRGKPYGGFVFIRVSQLIAMSVAANENTVATIELRCLLAMFEMVARREAASRVRKPKGGKSFTPKPNYDAAELAELLGVSRPKARSAANRLIALGLVVLQKDGNLRIALETKASLRFMNARQDEIAGRIAEGVRRAGKDASFLTKRNYSRKVPVPRRLIRHLAAPGARKPRILTALAVLSKALRFKMVDRKFVCVSGGGCSYGFAKTFFGVERPAFAANLRYFEELGWLSRLADDNWNKVRARGQWCIPNLAWGEPAVVSHNEDEVSNSRRMAAVNRTAESSKPARTVPSVPRQTLLSSKVDNHHEPQNASRSRERGDEFSEGRISWAKSFDRDMLRSTPKLLELFSDAARRGVVDDHGLWRVMFVALAQRALRVGRNPGAVFRKLIEERLYHFVTDAEEDLARRKILEFEQSREFPAAGAPQARAAIPKLRTPTPAEWRKMDVLEQAQWRQEQRRARLGEAA